MAPKGRRIVRSSVMPAWLSPGHALRRRVPSWRRLRRVLAILIAVAGLAVVAARLDPLPPRFSGQAMASDGDSLRIGHDRIRLIGLDAPELNQLCWRGDGVEWSCGRSARTLLAELLARGNATCDPAGRDRYGRTLARCEVAGEDLGARIVAAGLAVSSGGYSAEESTARRARIGIWSGRFVSPREWRQEGPSNDPGPGLFESIWIWFRELTGATALR